MGDASMTGEDRALDSINPVTLTLQAYRLGQMPLILFNSWWNSVVEAFWPCLPPCHHVAHHEEHQQLVVPEPIEAEGEHALFA